MTTTELREKYRFAPQRPDLPKGLEKVDWVNLQHAHGSAYDFPILLNATLSEERDDSNFAFQLLHETIWHQGTIYQATVYAIPFIAELATNPKIKNGESYAFLLASCLTGSPSFSDDLSSEQKDRWKKIYDCQGRNFEQTLLECRKTVIKIKEVGREFVQSLYPFLKSFENDHWVRGRIARALSVCPEFADESIPLIKQALENEEDEEARDDFIDAIDKLQKNKS
jgi:hypothetical protein